MFQNEYQKLQIGSPFYRNFIQQRLLIFVSATLSREDFGFYTDKHFDFRVMH
jgi:hypothetical protein